MPFDANKKAHKSSDVSVSVAPAPAKKPRTIDRNDIAYRLCSPERSLILSLADMLDIQLTTNGLCYWKQIQNGWRSETGEVLMFEQIERLIDAKIAMLGLDRTLIELRLTTPGEFMTPAEYHARERAWDNLSFDEKMSHFKKKENS